MYFGDNIIRICKNCHGTEPCQCSNPQYIEVFQWIYDLMKKLNPMG